MLKKKNYWWECKNGTATLEMSLSVSYKVKHIYHMTYTNSICWRGQVDMTPQGCHGGVFFGAIGLPYILTAMAEHKYIHVKTQRNFYRQKSPFSSIFNSILFFIIS